MDPNQQNQPNPASQQPSFQQPQDNTQPAQAPVNNYSPNDALQTAQPPLAQYNPQAQQSYNQPPQNQQYATNPSVTQPPQPLSSSDGYQTLMPTKNKKSLISYYMGVAGLLPIIGLPFAIMAIVYGDKALKAYKLNPTPGAKGHAITGIVLGCISLAIWALFCIVMIMSSLS